MVSDVMKMNLLFVVAGYLAGVSLHADTLTLRDGSQLEGAVVEFKNQKFEFESEKGVNNTYVLSDLLRIDFKLEGEDGGVATEMSHRTKGQLKGRVTEFVGGNFTFLDTPANAQSIPALMVTSATFAGGKVKDIEVITHGKKVDITKKLGPNRVTLIDFYADWCGPCRMISPHLELIVHKDKEVVLRKVDIVRWNTEVCQQYQIGSVPQVWVYDKKGKLVGKVTGANSQQVDVLVAKAKE